MGAKGIPMELGDGRTYTVAPVPLGFLEDNSDKLADIKGDAIGADQIKIMIDAILVSLKRNYPDMTRETVRNELVALDNMLEVFEAVMDVSGLKRKQLEADAEAAAAGETQGAA